MKPIALSGLMVHGEGGDKLEQPKLDLKIVFVRCNYILEGVIVILAENLIKLIDVFGLQYIWKLAFNRQCSVVSNGAIAISKGDGQSALMLAARLVVHLAWLWDSYVVAEGENRIVLRLLVRNPGNQTAWNLIAVDFIALRHRQNEAFEGHVDPCGIL